MKEQPTIDKTNEETGNTYKREVDAALIDLYRNIRSDLLSKPRIIPLTDLTSKLESILSEKGIEVTDSTKKHLSRNLKTVFGESLQFFTHKRRVYIRPHTLTINSISCDYLDLKSELAKQSQGQKREERILQKTVELHNQVKMK